MRACDWGTLRIHATIVKLWAFRMLNSREERRAEGLKKFRMQWGVRIVETKFFPAVRLWKKTALDRLKQIISRSYVVWSLGARIHRKRKAVSTIVCYLGGLKGVSKYQRVMKRHLNRGKSVQCTKLVTVCKRRTHLFSI
jgi:hypothetical protein